jgi:hypothetical protein
MTAMSDHADDTPMGPISYLIVEFPGNNMTGEGLAHLIDLSDRGVIRVIDLAFVTRGDDGSIVALDLHEIDGGGFDLSIFAGASSGVLDQSDFDEAAAGLEPGSSVGILIFENCWAANFVEGLRRGGAELVSAGYIPIADLVAALDATEPN